jgi:hypothetical protein
MPESNPFYHRGPIRQPEFFFGHSREVDFLFELLRKGQSVAVSGPRRIGKTSLLFHIQDPVVHSTRGFESDQTHFLCLDGGMLDGLNEDCFYGAIDRALGGENEALTYQQFLDRLRNFFQAAPSTRIILLIDEFELIAANPQFGLAMFNRLRGLASQYPLQYVTASKLPLWQLTVSNRETLSSPFFNIFAPLPVGLLEMEDARALLTSLSQDKGKPFPAHDVETALSLSGTHPLFLQVTGYRMFECAETDGGLPDGVWPQIRQKILSDLEPHLSYYWNDLSSNARYALASLPFACADISELAESGLICGGCYSGSIVERFVRKQTVDGLLQRGPFLLDLRRSLISVAGEVIHLTPTEFSLLRVFVSKPGCVLTPEEIEAALWPEDQAPDPERARGVVKKLRAALGSAGEHIVNRRGQGYLLSVD